MESLSASRRRDIYKVEPRPASAAARVKVFFPLISRLQAQFPTPLARMQPVRPQLQDAITAQKQLKATGKHHLFTAAPQLVPVYFLCLPLLLALAALLL